MPDSETIHPPASVNKFSEQADGFRWEESEVLVYKPTGTHFRDITRQVLFDSGHGLPTQLRYFEIEPGGHSTLERHRHVHAVVIIRGKGQALLGDQIHDVDPLDSVYVPPMTWHQFRASRGEALGFLCLVDCERDRPIRPDDNQLEELLSNPAVARFIRY